MVFAILEQAMDHAPELVNGLVCGELVTLL